ncbi:hypothetical protein BGZ50_000270, partial [Haplosporangium sp. Z 11]
VKYTEHVNVRDMFPIYSYSSSEDEVKGSNEDEVWDSSHSTASSEADYLPVVSDISNEPSKSNVTPKEAPNLGEHIEIL